MKIGDEVKFSRHWRDKVSRHTGKVSKITPSGIIKIKSEIGTFEITKEGIFRPSPKPKNNLFTPWFQVIKSDEPNCYIKARRAGKRQDAIESLLRKGVTK